MVDKSSYVYYKSDSEIKQGDDMKEHRGQHRKELFKLNRDAVRRWLKDNPEKTMKDCSVDLGLSYLTARNHIKEILKEKPGK